MTSTLHPHSTNITSALHPHNTNMTLNPNPKSRSAPLNMRRTNPISLSSSLSLSTLSPTIPKSNHAVAASVLPLAHSSKSINLRFCGLRRELIRFSSLSNSVSQPLRFAAAVRSRKVTAALSGNGSAPRSFDYDLLIISTGVGGHGAALHAVK